MFSKVSVSLGPWTLIHPASNWTQWATLWCHPCLSKAATSASSQVNPIFCKSLLTVLLQFALGWPGPHLYPGTCQYSACCGMRWWSIRTTCPSQRSRLSLSMLSMVCCPVLVLTSTFVILSFQEMPSIVLLCHLWCAASSLFVNVAVNGHTSAPYRRVDKIIASYNLLFTLRLMLLFFQIFLNLPQQLSANKVKNNNIQKIKIYQKNLFKLVIKKIIFLNHHKVVLEAADKLTWPSLYLTSTYII